MTAATAPVLLTAAELRAQADDFAGLLVEVVADGASVGFLAPLDRPTAATWWTGRAALVADGDLLVWSVREGGRLVATVSVVPVRTPNGRHRAEVVKLMVRPASRGRGLARRLLDTAERGAAGAGATLLLLDTETGSPADRLYRSAGWTATGVVPDYASDPYGTLRACTFFHKPAGAPERRGC